LGNIYPDLENAIRKHKSEQHSRARELIKEINKYQLKSDLPMP
jgi:hypothetical protein